MLAGFKHEKDQKEESSHDQMEVFEHDQEKDITIKQHLQIEKEDKVDVQDEVKFEDLNKNCEETGGNILHHFCSEMQDNDIKGEEDNTEINNQIRYLILANYQHYMEYVMLLAKSSQFISQ